jgi:hypothetical protein
MFAFSAPAAPSTPQYLSGTDTAVTLTLFPSPNDNGVRVASYELWIALEKSPIFT